MKYSIVCLLLFVGIINLFAQGDIIFFSESPDPTYYDPSWGYKSGGSDLELLGPGFDKFPVDTEHPYLGSHSLRLHWQSESGGDWGIAVASIGWTGHDLTTYDSIVYWVNAPQAVNQSDLPAMELEDTFDSNSTRISIGNFFFGVDSDPLTWQRVSIPIDSFSPGPQNCDFTRIKTIFHFQHQADGVNHEVWIDEVRAKKIGGSTGIPERPLNIAATGYDSRIDLKWRLDTDPNLVGYFMYRSASPTGPFTRVNPTLHEVHIFSDFLGQNNQTYYYYATAANQSLQESSPSDTVFATSYLMTEEELITSVQEAIFRYFYDYGHPLSGLARERNGKGNSETCASGGTGFGLMALVVGSERGFVSRDSAASRVVKILRFLQDQTTRYHGAWSHWINGSTGSTIPFSQYDDGGDLVETSYLVQGLLTVRQYFNLNTSDEIEIRNRATQMWESVEWDWYRKDPPTNFLYWHWSPVHDWTMNMPVVGYNEAMILYLLAIASPAYPVPASLYYNGWASPSSYLTPSPGIYYGIRQWVGPPRGGPLFFTHYSFLGFDPRNKQDQFCNYFENSRNISLIHQKYCMANPYHHTGYDSLTWGLTASDDPFGYSAHAPYSNDNGTITPSAAISAMAYTPEQSIATLKHFYFTYGSQLWGEFGFKDAFNLDQNWFADSYIAIDQGPMIVMMENYRSQLCWNLFMANPEITQMLNSIGWTVGIEQNNEPLVGNFDLKQNFPNPFNSSTMMQFSLVRAGKISLEIYDILGQKVKVIYNDEKMVAGVHELHFSAQELPSGVYFYRLSGDNHTISRKMLLIR
jgi:hypothetical protein